MSRTAPDIYKRLSRWRLILLLVGLSVFAVAWPIDQAFVFDRRIESLFPENDPAVAAYQNLTRQFGGNDIVVMAYPGADLMNKSGDGLNALAQLAQQLRDVPGVRSVLSLAKVSRALSRITSMGFGTPSNTAILSDRKLETSFRDLFANYTHSPDGDYAALVIILNPDRDKGSGSDQTIVALRKIANNLPAANQPTSLVGEPVLVDEGFSMAEADGKRLGTVTLALLSIVILIIFRSPKWMLIQLVVIYWSTVVTRAFLGSIGLQLTLVSSMLTAVVTVVAVASIIHIAVNDRNARLRGFNPIQSSRIALSAVLAPIAWACATDAVGFGSLAISDVGPIRDFGIMMAVGAVVVLAAIVLLVPALSSIGPRRAARRPRQANRTLRHAIYAIYVSLAQQRRTVLCALLLLTCGTIWGLSLLKVETNFIRNFRSGHRIAIDYGTVEHHLGGAGVWDVLLPAPKGLPIKYLDSVRKLENDLRALGKDGGLSLTKVLSIADADKAASASLPLSLAPPSLRIAGMREAMPHFVNALLTAPDSQKATQSLRIMLRSHEQASADEKLQLIRQVSEVITKHTSSPAWRQHFATDFQHKPVQVTGYSVLLTGLVAGLTGDQWICFGAASVGVFLMLLILSRSIKLAACAMIPNILPILAVIAAIGLSGFKMNLGTAMIAAVSIGISIDGSIHFLCGYRKQRTCHDVSHSIQRLYKTVGLAVLLATISLVLGFMTLITSPFVPTSTFGLLVSISLIVSSIANLTLLPATIRWIMKDDQHEHGISGDVKNV